MEDSNSILTNQIKYYYLFHKQIENIFQSGQNPLYTSNYDYYGKPKIKLFYVLDTNLLDMWKNYCN